MFKTCLIYFTDGQTTYSAISISVIQKKYKQRLPIEPATLVAYMDLQNLSTVANLNCSQWKRQLIEQRTYISDS